MFYLALFVLKLLDWEGTENAIVENMERDAVVDKSSHVSQAI